MSFFSDDDSDGEEETGKRTTPGRPKDESLSVKKERKKAVKEAQAEKRKTKIKKHVKKRAEKEKKKRH